MSNILTGYLNKRLKEKVSSERDENWRTAGPVITISREVGCSGLSLANIIANSLNIKKQTGKWKVLSKEIFYQSAQELNMDPERVQRVFKQSDKYTFEEILKAFSNKSYKSEKKIINTVTDVVRSFAIEGYTIIVGRAGHIIANDIKNALHIRLTAPLNFRIEEIQRKDDLSRVEAFARIEKIEKERISFRRAIREENLHEELFDLIINRESFSENEIVDIVKLAMKKKGILERVKANVQYY
jgi:cytidylate kinase